MDQEQKEDLYPFERESRLGMSNYNYEIDQGFEEELKAGKWGRHAGMEFNSEVRWDGESFCAEVWRYGAIVANLKAPTLRELMDQTNDAYGWT